MASIERRSNKRTDVFVVRFRDSTGRQRSKSFGTRREAASFAYKVETQLREDDWIDPRKARMTFGDFHARWVLARAVAPSRAAAEESQARVHILPRWSRVPLSRIRPLDVDAWIKHMQGGAPTKVMVLQQFKLCLDAAVREGRLRVNPATNTKAPSLPRKRVTHNDVLSADELDRLVMALPDRYQTLVYLSGWFGWRWSEAMGLRVSDVDLDKRVIYVGNEVVTEVKGQLTRRSGGKTATSTRTVPIPSAAVAVLRRHMDGLSTVADPTTPLFTTESGDTPYRSNFRRIFQRAVADAGLAGRGINFRQLRHTAASLMLSSGLDVLDVQDRLGHARGSTTLDIYGRVLASRRDLGTDLLGAAMTQSLHSFSCQASTHDVITHDDRAKHG